MLFGVDPKTSGQLSATASGIDQPQDVNLTLKKVKTGEW